VGGGAGWAAVPVDHHGCRWQFDGLGHRPVERQHHGDHVHAQHDRQAGAVARHV
jgi:hypothetical protein